MWDSTIRELFHEFAIAVDQARARLERDVRRAWLINVMEHGKQIGPLDKWLGIFRATPKAPQPKTQQRMALEMIFGPNRAKPRAH